METAMDRVPEDEAAEVRVIAPSDALLCPVSPSADLGKIPFFVYSEHNEQIFKEIVDVLTRQPILALATIFDATSAKVGLRNLSYFIVSITSPAMTYVFNCNCIVADDLFLDLRNILQNRRVLKLVQSVNPTIGFLMHRQHIDMTNVFDLQRCDKVLRRLDDDDALASLGDLIRLYVDPNFVDDFPLGAGNVGLDYKTAEQGTLELQAAVQGAFLKDIYRNQQQVTISPVVQHLDTEVKTQMAVFGKKRAPGFAKQPTKPTVHQIR